MPKARSSLLEARCVRDCSGILCERNGKWDSGTGIWEFGDIFERGEMKRAKIERKARRVAERPKKANDKRLMAKELRN